MRSAGRVLRRIAGRATTKVCSLTMCQMCTGWTGLLGVVDPPE